MLRDPPPPAIDPEALLLGALGWICADGDRAMRLLALTGLDADGLRARAGERSTLMAVAQFLADHEPALIACAESLGQSPGALIDAGKRLGRDR